MIIEPGKFYRTGQVAAWLEHTAKWFCRNRRALERKGFPAPVPQLTGHPRYRGDDLLAWYRTSHSATHAADNPGLVFDLAAVARERSKAMFRRAS